MAYQSPEQKALEEEALRLFVAVNEQIERIGKIIRELKELVMKGGEKDAGGDTSQNRSSAVSREGE